MTDIDYSPANHLSTGGTVAFIVLVNLALLGALAYALWSRQRHARRAQQASASVSLGDPRSTGHMVLYGTVETESKRAAVTVTVREYGEDHVDRNKVSYSWKEIDRRVEVAPFTLVLPSGTRVRVEPDPDVFLVDKLVITERSNPRTRQAALDHGELAYVDGVLDKGWLPRTDASQVQGGDALYRDAGPTGLVMKHGVERMLISTEPLARRHQRRSSAHGLMAIVLSVALLLMNTAVFGSAILVDIAGDVVETRVLAKRVWDTSGKGGPVKHYGLRASYVDPATGRDVEVDDEVSFAAHYAASNRSAIPFRVVLRSPSYCAVGRGASFSVSYAMLVVMAVVGLSFLYWKKVRGSYEWYDQAILEEHGSGHLQL
jgi:hypothetical protein